jgi:Bifunctional DNA primase/polymerase, N-terminal
MTANTLRAALELGATGIPAFPCLLDKRPSCPHGFKDATADPEKLNALWQQYPGQLIGVPTGSVSGIDALDLDAKHAEAIA